MVNPQVLCRLGIFLFLGLWLKRRPAPSISVIASKSFPGFGVECQSDQGNRCKYCKMLKFIDDGDFSEYVRVLPSVSLIPVSWIWAVLYHWQISPQRSFEIDLDVGRCKRRTGTGNHLPEGRADFLYCRSGRFFEPGHRKGERSHRLRWSFGQA